LFSITTIALLLTISYACKDTFLEQIPTGSTNNAVLATKDGVEGMLIGAYSGLMEMGSYGNQWGGLEDGPKIGYSAVFVPMKLQKE